MDPTGWAVLVGAIVIAGVLIMLAPRMARDHRRRQQRGAGGSLSGVGIGLDAVWRPSAEEALADWEAKVELPAPAPVAGDKGRIADGRIVLDVDEDRKI